MPLSLVDGMSTASTGATSTSTPSNRSPSSRRTSTPRKRSYSPAPSGYTATRRSSTRRSHTPSRRSSLRSPSSSTAKSVPRSRPGRIRSIEKPKPKPPPSVKEYLSGDTGYQQLVRSQQKTLADFLSDIKRQRGEAKTSFADVTRNMEQEKERALEAMQNEFASRGLLKSGLFAEEQGQYNQDWQSQMNQLEQGQQSLLADLVSQRRNFKREQQQAKETARQDAIRRRAQKYGLS